MNNSDQIKKQVDTPEGLQAIERAALRDLLAQIERGEGEQVETRRRVGDVIHLLTEDIGQRQELARELQRVQLTLSTVGNYMENRRAAYEAKQAQEG